MTTNNGHDFVQSIIVDAVNKVNPLNGCVGVAPVSCGAFLYEGFDFDFCQSVPGCAPAVASGIKRVRPNALVFTLQNEVDLSAAGLSEAIHAANRGENITIIFASDVEFTSKEPEEPNIDVCNMLAGLKKPVYVTRVYANEKNKEAALKAVTNAFTLQQQGKGFSLVEIVNVTVDEDSEEAKKLFEELPAKAFKDVCGVEKA